MTHSRRIAARAVLALAFALQTLSAHAARLALRLGYPDKQRRRLDLCRAAPCGAAGRSPDGRRDRRLAPPAEFDPSS